MHGLGNDCLIIHRQILPQHCQEVDLAKQIADRRTGIGSDQVIIYDKVADYYQMTIYNQDGSRAETCGSAARCLAWLIYYRFNQSVIRLKTASRELICRLLPQPAQPQPLFALLPHSPVDNLLALDGLEPGRVSVNMGPVAFSQNWMLKPAEMLIIKQRYLIDSSASMILADIGNRHVVIFGDFSPLDQQLIGSQLQQEQLFAGGINVNFAVVRQQKIYLSVWERGAGLTLACGSGACVTFAAAVKLGFAASPAEIVFSLGSLSMSLDNQDIIMQGPASWVAAGEFYYR